MGAAPPWEWYVSQLCDEFHCLPSQLFAEDQVLIDNIMGLRSYSRAKQQLDNAKNAQDVRMGYWHEQVFEIQREMMRERMGKHGA